MADFKILFGIFITVIVAVALVTAIADEIWDATTPDKSWENISISGLRTASEAEAHPNLTANLAGGHLLGYTVWLSNGTLLTEGTDYHINDTGSTEGDTTATFSIVNTSITYTKALNWTVWNYTHAGGQYVQGSNANRTILGLVTLFFVIGILATILMFLSRTDIIRYR